VPQQPAQHRHQKIGNIPQHHKRQVPDNMSKHLPQHKQKKSDLISPHSTKQKRYMSNHISQLPIQYVSPQYRGYKGPFKRCDHCGKSGHLRSECFHLLGYPQKSRSLIQRKKKEIHAQRIDHKDAQTKKVWRPKATNKI
jgi:hypothetical protein